MDTADRMKSARKDRGWSQRKLAENLGVSVQAVSQWETGKTSPTFNNASRIADLLSVDVRWLLAGAEQLSEDVGKRTPVTKEDVYKIPVVYLDDTVFFSRSDLISRSDQPYVLTSIFSEFHFLGSAFGVLIESSSDPSIFRRHDIAIFDNGLLPNIGDILLYFEVRAGGRYRLRIGRLESSDPSAKPIGIAPRSIRKALDDQADDQADVMIGPPLAVLVEVRRYRFVDGVPWPSSET